MKKSKRIFVGMAVLALLFGLVLVGCASAPPTAFETAESLEGTAWYQNSILVIKDGTSGVLTDGDDKETAFTYTAVYDAQKRTFTGTINLEDGRVAEFSARRIAVLGWALSAKELERANFFYATPERLEEIYRQKRELAELIKKYGIEYNGLYGITLTRNSDKKMITYGYSGLHETTGKAMQSVPVAWKLHSKDGVAMTLILNDMNIKISFKPDSTSQKDDNTEGVGSFNIRISGKNVTISNGTGAGAAFNGSYTAERDIDAQVTATHVQKQQAYEQRQTTSAQAQQTQQTQTQVTTTPTQTEPQTQATVIPAQTQQTEAQEQATAPAQQNNNQAIAAPPVDSSTAWKNKWIYLGGMIGGGIYTYEYTDTYYEYDYTSYYSSPKRRTRTVNGTHGLFGFGVLSEFALLPFLSLELDLGLLNLDPIVPIMVKLGYRFDRVELFFDAGYTINLGLSLGGTFGYNIGPGVLFLKILDVPPILSTREYSDGNVIMGFVGYKVGLVDKR